MVAITHLNRNLFFNGLAKQDVIYVHDIGADNFIFYENSNYVKRNGLIRS